MIHFVLGCLQIQHLQAQVDLLEADSAGRHSDSRPGSPRESETDRLSSHVESLQADNTRLQMQVIAMPWCTVDVYCLCTS